jgi:hypothetical protein
VVVSVLGALWLSGVARLVLHYGYSTPTEFGATPHPWGAPVLTLHGVVGVAVVFLLGWLAATHVTPHWPSRRRRATGIGAAVVAGILGLTGFALYYLVDAPLRAAIALGHEVLGTVAIALVLLHALPRPAARARIGIDPNRPARRPRVRSGRGHARRDRATGRWLVALVLCAAGSLLLIPGVSP